MISSLTGELRRIDGERAQLSVGPMICDVLVPSVDLPELQSRLGAEITFHTIFYFQGDAGGGSSIEPRLIGFLRAQDKRFFERFITVKGIGPKKALKALASPFGEIAAAIEARNARFLVGLPEIGKRLAETIIAELAGKVVEFAGTATVGARGSRPAGTAIGTGSGGIYSEVEEDAIVALVALGERRADAERLLERAKSNAGAKPLDAGSLVREMLMLRGRRE